MKTKLTITFTSIMAVLLIVSIATVTLTACGRKTQFDGATSIAAMLIDVSGETTEDTNLPSVPSGCEVLPSSNESDKPSSQNSTGGGTSTGGTSSKAPGNSSVPPAASSTPPAPSSEAPAPWKPNPADYAWLVDYAVSYGSSIGLTVWRPNEHPEVNKNTASWGSPTVEDGSSSDATLKKIIGNKLSGMKQTLESHGSTTPTCKIYMEVYEHDSDLIAIYFLY
jgi:hypothetical protein